MKIEMKDNLLTLTPEGRWERKTIEDKTKKAMAAFGVSSRVGRIFAAVTIATELGHDISVDNRQVTVQDQSFSIYPRGLDGMSIPEVLINP